MKIDAIDTISFDLDNTLCRYDQPPGMVLEQAFDMAGYDPFFTLDEYVAQFDRFASDAPDMPTLRRRCFGTLAESAGRSRDDGIAVAKAYNELRDPPAIVWRRGMQALVDALDEVYTLIVITNGLPDAQQAKLEQLGVLDRFETIVYGGGTYPRKPDPTPFTVAIDRVDTTPAAAAHIGNSRSHDVDGANRAGFTSIWLPDPSWDGDPDGEHSTSPDHTVTDADELRSLLLPR